MKLNQIDSVFAVAKHLNFTAAARSLNLSQPALSKQISLLEEELGVNLFTRDKRSVTLTPAGETFLEEFEIINKQISKSIIKIRRSVKACADCIEIGYPHAISCNSFLPPILQTFSQKHPEFKVNLSRFNLPELNRKFLNDELDIIFSFSFELKNLHPIEFQVVKTRIPSLIMSAENPLTRMGSISFEDLKNETFIMLDKDISTGSFFKNNETFEHIGYYPESIIYTENIDTLISLVELNRGITILHDSVCRNNDLVSFNIFDEKFAFDIVSVRKKETANPGVAAFEKVLSD